MALKWRNNMARKEVIGLGMFVVTLLILVVI